MPKERIMPADTMEVAQFSKILFLDFDGVLHRYSSGTFSKLPLLCEFLRAHRDVGVVISSSWRDQFSLEKLREFFEPDIRTQIIDTTPLTQSDRTFGRLYRGRSRSDEIQEWLSSRPVQAFAMLDDEPKAFTSLHERLVCTDAREGLTNAELLRVAELLNLSRATASSIQ